MANRMMELAQQQPGFIGIESARDEIGITVSYWKSLEAIQAWKNNAEHLVAQQLGKEKWYEWFTTRIAKIEREYYFGENNLKYFTTLNKKSNTSDLSR